MGGINPKAGFLLSFSDLDFAKGTRRGGRGDSVRSAMGEGGDCVLGAVMLGNTPPVLRVLLLRRVTGEVVDAAMVVVETSLVDEGTEPGDFGEVVWGVDLSTDTTGGAIGALVMFGRIPDPEERRGCDEAMGGPPSGVGTF